MFLPHNSTVEPRPSIRPDLVGMCGIICLKRWSKVSDQLYISWVGRSIRDNSERPACVLIGPAKIRVSIKALILLPPALVLTTSGR